MISETSGANGSNGHAQERTAVAGSPTRFERRWHLTGAGLSNVWRFGNLELPAASGRLLLRGPNGTGKTTVLEALLPYLLDLDAAKLSAGKSRTTNLASLMREGSPGKRRIGYAWLTLRGPQDGTWSFGVRLQFSDGSSPPVKVIPFGAPGRLLHEIPLHGPGRAPLTLEQFTAAVEVAGGQIFVREEAYVSHLAARLFATPAREEVAVLASRLRQIRNPALLADISPQSAAAALRESLPGVADDVVAATAEALAESDTTREAFARDKDAAEHLGEFRDAWCAHATEVVTTVHEATVRAARDLRSLQNQQKARTSELEGLTADAATAKQQVEHLESTIVETKAELDALKDRQEYKDADRLKELKRSASALTRGAELAIRAMEETCRRVRQQGESLRGDLENLVEDLGECTQTASAADPTALPAVSLLVVSTRARPVLRAGDALADPGPELVIDGDAARFRDTASAWSRLAGEHEHRSDTAAVAITDHQPVEAARRASDEAARIAREKAAFADAELTRSRRAEMATEAESRTLLDHLVSWTRTSAELTAATTRGPGWGVDDVSGLLEAEPARILSDAEAWAHHAIVRAESIAGDARARAQQLRAESTKLQSDAEEHRARAAKLQTEMLPFPRPDWAGAGDDTIALGSALEWRADFNDARERAILEGAMAACGLLGATVAPNGASTPLWSVDATGLEVEQSLAALIAVDEKHPLAVSASAVLARIALAASAHDDAVPGASLVLGRDGTFRAGVLRARIPGADDPAQLAPASHVGAHQRREAALAQAALLEQEAAKLIENADQAIQQASELERRADAVSELARTFPSREGLREAEAQRVLCARASHEAQVAARTAQDEQTRLVRDHAQLRDEWLTRTRSHGLPVEVEQLVRMRDNGKATAQRIRHAAATLSSKLADRLARALARYSPTEISEQLRRSETETKVAVASALEAVTAVRVLEETAGAEIRKILERHDQVTGRLAELEKTIVGARDQQVTAARDEASARAKLEQVQQRLREAEPAVARQLADLRALIQVPGVVDAVLDGDPLADDTSLVAQVTTKLQGRKTMARKTVRERADGVRAALAGIWALDPGDDHGELLTYLLTHRDATYTPPQAAAHAKMLERRAEQALAASEERALHDFVVGRLPTAISTAWTRLHDWSNEVNRKMRSAAASSGVAVQVRIPLRDDLAAATREVYELACKTSDFERTPEQQRRLADALRSLLAAAEGEDMLQRVASAVNIREWVDVHYEVTRPGGKSQRWSSRTGLSSGERRLVVLAPMLAATASAYDRLGDKALRIVALDEVPAEVDERGRESLARYIADLDLDLICTSYVWDGCPGAWDGIDAHDLEAGPDGTVVAFPMLVRGANPIPEVMFDSGSRAEPGEPAE
jgi:energy-coupling factor transporter ATP-binding protein EcfA2